MQNEKDDPALLERESSWRALSIATAILFLIAVFAAAIWIVSIPSHERVEMVSVLSPFGVAIAAIVTFCGAMWRGMISTRQADDQRAQLAKLSEQIAATDENNLASLLQKGAELIGDGKPAHVAGGLATLEAVISAPNPKFARAAMNLVADYLEREHASSHQSPLARTAISLLDLGAKAGFRAQRVVNFRAATNARSQWRPVSGVIAVQYSGGDMYFREGKESENFSKTPHSFSKVKFQYGMINLRTAFKECYFENCKIIDALGYMPYQECRFRGCDFSGCALNNRIDLTEVELDGCYYKLDNPPRFEDGREYDFSRHFVERGTRDDPIPF